MRDPRTSEQPGPGAFLARWSSLFDGASEPWVVAWTDTLAPAYANEAADVAFGDALATRVRDALSGSALQALHDQGLWRGRDPESGWALCALGLAGAGGGVDGVALTWTPDPPLARPLPGTLRRLVDLAADLIVGVEGNGRIVYRNGRARAFFPREILGLRARDALQAAAIGALRGGSPAPEETVNASGERRVLLWKALSLDGHGGHPGVAVGRDVTEVQLATARLENRVKRLEAMHALSLALGRGEPLASLYALAFVRLAELVPVVQGALYQVTGDGAAAGEARLVGLYAWDRGEGRALDEAIALGGHPCSEAVRRRGTVTLPTAGPAALDWPQLRTLSRQGMTAALAVPLLEENRIFGVLWLVTARTVGFSPDDQAAVQEVSGLLVNAMVRQRLLDRIAGYTRELEARVEARTTELRSTQEQLLAAARLSSIGEMSAGVAHELNQPLNVISGYIELLQDGDLSGDEAARALGVMANATERMTSLVRHLRDFSRAGVETLRGVDLRQIIDMARELTARATRRPIQVRWERPGQPVTVLGDPGRLEQLFINLLANAMQATEAHGGAQVSVRLGRAGEDLAVEIEDQGPGVPSHLRKRIFEPFFTTKDRGHGTGLGLSISAKIAAEHQGSIQVDDGPGGGAVFRVVLPSYRVG